MPTPSERAASALASVRSGTRAAAMATLTLGMLGGVTLHQRLAGTPRAQPVFQDWMRTWADGLLHVFGMRVTLASPPPSAAHGPRLVVANHRSPIDILLLLKHFGGVVLSRADLEKWPVLGLAAQRAETIFVDRTDTMSGITAIRTMRERLQQGRTVIVFPEGMTSVGDEVRPFHGGAFTAARGLPVEVVTAGIAYERGAEFWNETFMHHMQRVAGRPATRLACAFGQPRPLGTKRKELADDLHADVQRLVQQARWALDADLNRAPTVPTTDARG
jgi:lyso-ornithine lipid O-acyltransferase